MFTLLIRLLFVFGLPRYGLSTCEQDDGEKYWGLTNGFKDFPVDPADYQRSPPNLNYRSILPDPYINKNFTVPASPWFGLNGQIGYPNDPFQPNPAIPTYETNQNLDDSDNPNGFRELPNRPSLGPRTFWKLLPNWLTGAKDPKPQPPPIFRPTIAPNFWFLISQSRCPDIQFILQKFFPNYRPPVVIRPTPIFPPSFLPSQPSFPQPRPPSLPPSGWRPYPPSPSFPSSPSFPPSSYPPSNYQPSPPSNYQPRPPPNYQPSAPSNYQPRPPPGYQPSPPSPTYPTPIIRPTVTVPSCMTCLPLLFPNLYSPRPISSQTVTIPTSRPAYFEPQTPPPIINLPHKPPPPAGFIPSRPPVGYLPYQTYPAIPYQKIPIQNTLKVSVSETVSTPNPSFGGMYFGPRQSSNSLRSGNNKDLANPAYDDVQRYMAQFGPYAGNPFPKQFKSARSMNDVPMNAMPNLGYPEMVAQYNPHMAQKMFETYPNVHTGDSGCEETRSTKLQTRMGGDEDAKVIPIDVPADFTDRTISGESYLNHEKCGIVRNDNGDAISDRIFGGGNVTLGLFPWIARIGYKVKNSIQFKCGGTLITPYHVITAAHCVAHASSDVTVIRLGEHDERTDVDCVNDVCADPVQDIEPWKIYYHTDYKKSDIANDIAIIVLQEPAKLSKWVLPICVPYQRKDLESIGIQLAAAGWGYYNERSKPSAVLRAVNLPSLELDICRNEFKNSGTIDDRQMCIGGIPGEDSCNGDSGGPLMRVDDGQTPRWQLVGIVSFGASECGTKNVPAIYTKISAFYSWITYIVSNKYPPYADVPV